MTPPPPSSPPSVKTLEVFVREYTQRAHTPPCVLPKREAYIFLDIGKWFCRGETESGLLRRRARGLDLDAHNNSGALSHTLGGFLSWLIAH